MIILMLMLTLMQWQRGLQTHLVQGSVAVVVRLHAGICAVAEENLGRF